MNYRLSAMVGAKLRDNNPAITDLNDPNRPMKIGEQFSGVYENEWTDAFLNLEDMKSDVNESACINEEEAIAILLNILRVNTYLHRDAFICIFVRDPIIKQGVFGIPLTGLIPPHFQYLSHAGTSTLKRHHLVVFFVFNGLR